MAAEHFKVCPLCGALNVVENEECFVCSWHNEFDENPVVIEMKILDLMHECPDLLEAVSTLATPPKSSFKQRLASWWRKLFGRLDLRA
jgi:hypothetical protein